jgi:NADH dehydrogenase
VSKLAASFLGLLPKPLLTRDQLEQLRSDNVVSQGAEAEGRTLSGLGIEAQSMATILPSYLWRFRAAGQFQRRQTA